MVIFWAYIAFSQYLLIWYANIPKKPSGSCTGSKEPGRG